jgi:hypothetical protein
LNDQRDRKKYQVNNMRLFLILCFFGLVSVQTKAQGYHMPSNRVYGYWIQVFDACKAKNEVLMDSLFEAGKGDDSLLSPANTIVLALYLGKYDELRNWFLIATPTALADPLSPYLDVFGSLAMNARKKKDLSLKLKNDVDKQFSEGELKDLIQIVLVSSNTPINEHETYNKCVLDFLNRYPSSRFRTYVGTDMNAESAPTGGSFGMDIVLGPGVFQDLGRSGGVSWKNWEAGMIDIRYRGGYKKNFFSIGALLALSFDSVPRYVDQDGPFRNYNYGRLYLRYDRQLIQSRRLDGFVFADMGMGRADLVWDTSEEEEEIENRIIGFGSLSCGLKLNWNFYAPKDVIYVDTPFYTLKSYLSLEIGVLRNFYNFTPYYRSMLMASLSFGLTRFGTRVIPNSGMAKDYVD